MTNFAHVKKVLMWKKYLFCKAHVSIFFCKLWQFCKLLSFGIGRLIEFFHKFWEMQKFHFDDWIEFG